MNYDDIGEFIKEKRKEKGLTQKELASMLGVTDKAVSKWETGLGCPDVSILEVLSKCLDCSILELLKGREIEGEVIPITEADDYIKDSLKYGENNFKRSVSKIIAAIVIFIVSILFILNIINIYNQRKKYTNPNDMISIINEKIDVLNKNIGIIEKNHGRYSKEDYDTIKSLLYKTQEEIESLPYITSHSSEYTMSDLYIMDIYSINYSNLLTIIRTLSKYDNNMEDELNKIVESIGTRMFLGASLTKEPYDLIYTYQFIKYNRAYNYNPNIYVQAREYDIYYRLSLYIDVTNDVIKVGDIHE